MSGDRSDTIRALIESGLDLIPVVGKAPRDYGWRTRRYAPEELFAHVESGGNVGVRLAEEQLIIDVDPRNGGDESFARLQADLGISFVGWPTVMTGGGGRHVYAAKPTGVRVRSELPQYKGVEFKTHGKQVVAPTSVHPETKRIYTLKDPLEQIGQPPVAPSALLELITRRPPAASPDGDAALSPSELAQVLAHIDPLAYGKGKYDGWLELSMACHAVTGGAAEAEWLAWCARDSKYSGDDRELSYKWSGFDASRPGGVGMGTLRMHAERVAAADDCLRNLLALRDFEPLSEDEIRRLESLPGLKRTIVLRPGDLPKTLDEAEQALILAGERIYCRGTELVRTIRIEGADPFDDGISRASGSLVLQAVNKHWLRERMALAAVWLKRGAGRPKAPKESEADDAPSLVAVDPPLMLSEHLLARGQWDFPAVRAIVRAPTISPDGRLLQRPGYDEASQLILDVGADEYPPVPDAPAKAEALSALEALTEPLRGFPFADEDARAVALSAVLTGLVRPSLDAAPLHAIDAPAAGTGKSMLAEVIGVIVSGTRPAAMSQSSKEEELEKRLASALIAGDQVLLVDNCNRALEGDLLCSMLTQSRIKTRILSRSENVELPSTCLVLATGNNLTFANDVGRRALVCRLDAGVERPDQRSFDFDPRAEAKARRPALVAAALTVMRAYVAAGHPMRGELTAVGSFDAWSSRVREPLVWLGAGDPASTIEQAIGSDPEIEFLKELLPLWHGAFGDRPITVKELDRETTFAPTKALGELRELLEDHLSDGRWDSRKIGKRLGKRKGRMAGSLRLEAGGSGMDGRSWRVIGR